MISVIICSRTPSISAALESNIKETIGIAHQLIVVDNSKNAYSIFEAYNIGVKKSHYPYLCFMHDDIEYHTNNWGLLAIDHFKDKKTGAIGIAGSPYATQMPGSWWAGGLVNEYIIPIANNINHPNKTATANASAKKSEVILLDGVWICLRKSLFEKISFDDSGYKGYHSYDMDISMQAYTQGYKLFSIFDILIKHNSKGNLNSNWFGNTLIYQKKWRNKLPASCIKLTYQQECEVEYRTLKELTNIMILNNVSKKKVYQLAMGQVIFFHKGYFFYKTPFYFFHYFVRFLLTSIQNL